MSTLFGHNLGYFSSIQPPDHATGFENSSINEDIGLECDCLPSCSEEVLDIFFKIN